MKTIPLRGSPANTPKLMTSDQLAAAANAGVQPIASWIEEVIETQGIGDKAAARIPVVIRALGVRTYPIFGKDGRSAVWFKEFPRDSISAEIECALALTAIAESGQLNRFRRCEACSTFFVGDPRAKWCSNACGSKVRQRKFRKARR